MAVRVLSKLKLGKGLDKVIANDLGEKQSTVRHAICGFSSSKRSIEIRNYAISKYDAYEDTDNDGKSVYLVFDGGRLIAVCSSIHVANDISERYKPKARVEMFDLDKEHKSQNLFDGNVYLLYAISHNKKYLVASCIGTESYKNAMYEITKLVDEKSILVHTTSPDKINYESLFKSAVKDDKPEDNTELVDEDKECLPTGDTLHLIDEIDFGKGSIPIKLKNRLSELGCETLEQVASIPKEEIFEAEGLGRKAEYLLDKALEEYGLA